MHKARYCEEPISGQSRRQWQKLLPDDYSFSNLFGPKIDYSYFEHADAYPFRPQARNFDLVNAWWMSELSLLAYVRDQGVVQDVLQNAGFAEVRFFDRDGTQAFSAYNDAFLVVAFRGTERDELEDVITDLSFWPSESEYGGRVHKGFQAALNRVWPEIAEYLLQVQGRSDGQLSNWFTGHSLGGALAALAARRFGPVRSVYTFGAPRVGNLRFRRHYPIPAFRFVNNNDIVPLLPPSFFFKHIGRLKYIDSRHRIQDRAGVLRRFQDSLRSGYCNIDSFFHRFGHKAISRILLDHLLDHAQIFYVIHIWNEMLRNE